MRIIESSIDSIFRSLISAAPRFRAAKPISSGHSDASFSSILDVYSWLPDTPRANDFDFLIATVARDKQTAISRSLRRLT